MSLFAALASGLRRLAGGLAPGSSLPPLADVKTAGGAAVAVLGEVYKRKIDIADAEALANGVQQILVDLGIEPGLVLEASKILEALVPVLIALVRTAAADGAFKPAPRGGPPITQGGWTQATAPADNDPQNPSGAIGGPDPQSGAGPGTD